jgi:hypothetical protein
VASTARVPRERSFQRESAEWLADLNTCAYAPPVTSNPAAGALDCSRQAVREAAADDRFAQFDVVGLTIASATFRSSSATVRRVPATA